MDFESLDIQLGADLTGLEAGLGLAASKVLKFAGTVGGAAQAAGAGFQAFVQQARDSGGRAADAFAQGFNSLNSKLSKTYDELEKRQEQYEKGFGRVGQSFTSIGTGLTAAITAPLTLLAGASLKTAGDLQALELGFKAVYKGAGDAGQALKETQALAKLPGLGLEEAIQGSIRLQAVGFSAEEAAKSLRAFGNAVATTGGGKADLDRITVQLGQLSAKGKVLSQDLRPIIEAAPLVAEALKKMYGTVDSDEISKKLQATGQSSKDFVATLTDELGKLPQVTGGLKNTFENFGDSVKLSVGKVGDSINKSFNVEGIINGLADKIAGLATAFSNLSPEAQKFIIVGAGLAAAVGPVLVAVGALLTALPSMAAGFALAAPAIAETGAAVLAFATGPVGLAVAAVATLAAGLCYASGASDRALKSYQDQAQEVQRLNSSVSPLLARYDELSAKTTKSAAEHAELKTVIQQLAEQVPSAATAFDTMGNAVGISTDKIREYRQALEEQKAAQAALNLPTQQSKLDEVRKRYQVLKDQLDEFNRTGSVTKAVFDEGGGSLEKYGAGSQVVNQLRSDLATANIELQKQVALVDTLAGDSQGFGALRASIEPLGDLYAKLGGGKTAASATITSLDSLKAKLKDLQDAFGKLQVGTKTFYDTKQQIIDLQALIKKYEDTGKAAKKAADEIAKAFADTSAKVKAVDVRVKLNLVASSEGMTEKIEALTAGIEKVTNLKVGTNDSRLQGLVSQLNTLIGKKQQLDASFGKSLPPLTVSRDVDSLLLDKIQADLDRAKLKANVEFQVTGDSVKLAQDLAAAQKQAQDAIIDRQVDPQNGQAMSITAAVKPLEFDAKNLDSLKTYSQTMRDITAQQAAFGAGFNGSAAAMQATAQRLNELISLGVRSGPEFDRLSALFKKLKMAAEFDDLKNNAAQALAGVIAEIGTTIADNLANVVTGTESVGDAFANIFSGVLGAVGGFLQDLGKQLITYGLLNLAFVTLAGDPLTAPAAIAVGIAAVTAGALFKSLSSSVKPSASGSGARASSPTVSTGSSPTASTAGRQNLNIQVTFQPVVLTADGASLRSVMQVDDYRLTTHR